MIGWKIAGLSSLCSFVDTSCNPSCHWSTTVAERILTRDMTIGIEPALGIGFRNRCKCIVSRRGWTC